MNKAALFGLLRRFTPRNDKRRHCDCRATLAMTAWQSKQCNKVEKSYAVGIKWLRMDCFVVALLAMTVKR